MTAVWMQNAVFSPPAAAVWMQNAVSGGPG